MKYETACNKAREMAKRSAEFTYVVIEDIELNDYQPASEYDMETFFFGCDPVICFDPDGDVAD